MPLAGLSDDYAQSFGFREFWIEGRNYFLNGTPFRARPELANSSSGIREVVDRQNKELMNLGFNLLEDWPNDMDERMPLASDNWTAILTQPLPPSTSPEKGPIDPGISTAARALMATDADETAMKTVAGPGKWENYGPEWEKEGEGVLRLSVDVPARWANQDLTLSLGAVDDETTFWNGEKIGSTRGWNQKRLYVVPAALVKAGKNVIAVRVWDNFGGGGFTSTSEDFWFQPAQPGAPVTTLYNGDYRTDFDFGDDPYRYYRW